MLGFIFDSVDNAISVAGAVMSGEDVSRQQVSKLIADGLTVAAAAAALNVSVDFVEKMLSEGE